MLKVVIVVMVGAYGPVRLLPARSCTCRLHCTDPLDAGRLSADHPPSRKGSYRDCSRVSGLHGATSNMVTSSPACECGESCKRGLA
jgi:hypothetical protein